MVPPIPSGPRLDRLTSLRFFAAILVLGSHSTRDLAPIPHISELFDTGTAGVTFFFALSGFVLTWSHRPDDTPLAFYRRRFARIYPIHAVTWLLAFPVLYLAGVKITQTIAVTNLFLVQAWVPKPYIYFGMNAPSWSLSAEMFFYLLFPLLVPLLARAPRPVLWGTLVVLEIGSLIVTSRVSASLGLSDANRFLFYVLPAWGLIAFVSGAIAARLMKSGIRIDVPVWAAVLLAGCGYLLAHFDSHRLGGIGHGIENAVLLPFILILIGSAATADLRLQPGFLTRPWALRLGEWSFALYMTHWLLLTAVVAVLPDLSTFPLVVRFLAQVVYVVAAIAVAALAYVAVERPLERRLRGARPRPAMDTSAIAS